MIWREILIVCTDDKMEHFKTLHLVAECNFPQSLTAVMFYLGAFGYT